MLVCQNINTNLNRMVNNIGHLCDTETASCKKRFNMQNDRLFNATMTALQTGDLSPLVKEELKYTIQSRRLAKGDKELKVDFPTEVQYELTEEEKMKRERRREQNRIAAQRFRQKKKEDGDLLCEKIQALEADNALKEAELNKLRKERKMLERILQEHLLVCRRDYET